MNNDISTSNENMAKNKDKSSKILQLQLKYKIDDKRGFQAKAVTVRHGPGWEKKAGLPLSFGW